MERAIRDFSKQFAWEPKIENGTKWRQYDSFIVAGMGGSHLAGDIFQAVVPCFNLSVYQDYGLPSWPMVVLKDTLIIASSYSGNTEETIDVFKQAMEKKIPVAAIATGGELLELAKKEEVPYIQIPDTGIQPRSALGFSFKSMAELVGRDDIVKEAVALATQLRAEDFEQKGKELADALHGKIPVIYASNANYSVAYNWKIKLNETGKVPAFYNVFPELSHNEINGFARGSSTGILSKNFSFIFLADFQDHARIQKRMDVLTKIYGEKGLPVSVISLEGETRLYRVFSSLLLADWTAYYTAVGYGEDAEQVPIVEEFKKLMEKES